MKKYYAVKTGKVPGIYRNWDSCKAQVHGFKGAMYKSFKTEEEALAYMGDVAEEKDDAAYDAVAYVDGSYRHEDRSYSYGVSMAWEGGSWEDSCRFTGDEAAMRNVAGEILGATVAMKKALALGFSTMKLCYDYAGIEHWAKGEWQCNKKGTIEYKAFYDSVKDRLAVTFVKIEAHTGVEGNERADTLAKEATFRATDEG
ncbi:ribonuclease H family protein [Peptoniphilus sp. EMRHCC_23]|uniref:ribonuclease H1 domain-containing protein n=1 Tax=Peptoniphilus rachelemmaiella TaxID=2811779 RepID=UPI001C0063F0|nr:ribonuclease H family protein [Peptoniphilus rachelemmaiella]